MLQVEYYIERWLRKAGNEIGHTIKVDIITLLASREKFARVCVEVDLQKPLIAGYRMRGEFWRLQYEGLIDLCFAAGMVIGASAAWPLKLDAKTSGSDGSNQMDMNETARQGERQSEEEGTQALAIGWWSIETAARQRGQPGALQGIQQRSRSPIQLEEIALNLNRNYLGRQL